MSVDYLTNLNFSLDSFNIHVIETPSSDVSFGTIMSKNTLVTLVSLSFFLDINRLLFKKNKKNN